MKALKELKKGTLFTLKEYDNPTDSQIYIKDSYDRTDKKYCCYKYSDVNNWRMIKGDKLVYPL